VAHAGGSTGTQPREEPFAPLLPSRGNCADEWLLSSRLCRLLSSRLCRLLAPPRDVVDGSGGGSEPPQSLADSWLHMGLGAAGAWLAPQDVKGASIETVWTVGAVELPSVPSTAGAPTTWDTRAAA
jgi:hypothetical protein